MKKHHIYSSNQPWGNFPQVSELISTSDRSPHIEKNDFEAAKEKCEPISGSGFALKPGYHKIVSLPASGIGFNFGDIPNHVSEYPDISQWTLIRQELGFLLSIDMFSVN